MRRFLIFTPIIFSFCKIETKYLNEDGERIIIDFKEIIIFLIVIYLLLVAEKLYKDRKKNN